MGDITIDVDGLPVDVDAEDWGADPDGVVEAVRAARAELALPEDGSEPPAKGEGG